MQRRNSTHGEQQASQYFGTRSRSRRYHTNRSPSGKDQCFWPTDSSWSSSTFISGAAYRDALPYPKPHTLIDCKICQDFRVPRHPFLGFFSSSSRAQACYSATRRRFPVPLVKRRSAQERSTISILAPEESLLALTNGLRLPIARIRLRHSVVRRPKDLSQDERCGGFA
jgi:hypothetical protein